MKYMSSKTAIPNLILFLLPLLIITDLKNGLFLSINTFANISLPATK